MGQAPYPGMSIQDVIQFVTCGNVMKKLNEIPLKIYNIMMKCWAQDTHERPAFTNLVDMLSECIGQATEVYISSVQDK